MTAWRRADKAHIRSILQGISLVGFPNWRGFSSPNDLSLLGAIGQGPQVSGSTQQPAAWGLWTVDSRQNTGYLDSVAWPSREDTLVIDLMLEPGAGDDPWDDISDQIITALEASNRPGFVFLAQTARLGRAEDYGGRPRRTLDIDFIATGGSA